MSRLPAHLHEHFHSDLHAGPPEGGHDRRGEARHPACGDILVIYLATEEGHVRAAGFKAQGCPAAMGTAAAACAVLAGLPVDGDLPETLRACFVDTYGEPAPAHRHALGLVVTALGAASRPARGA